ILPGLSSFVAGVRALPEGRRLTAIDTEGHARIWEIASGETTAQWQIASPLVCAAFSPAGDRVAIGSRKGNNPVDLKMLDSATGQELFPLAESAAGVGSLAFNPDGSQVAGADQSGRAIVWDAANGKRLSELQVDPRPGCLTFSPDGRRLAAGCA